MKRIFFLLLLFPANLSHAQSGNVQIIKNERVDDLVKKQSDIVPPSMVPQITGYRIQLFFDTEKIALDAAREKFITMYPKIDTYVHYEAPNYFLRVGNFRTKMEAEKIKAGIERDFPTNFIVRELIHLPRID
jgi:hypothetical protein